MGEYPDGYYHDAAEDRRASYEAHPVDEMEPERQDEFTREEQYRSIKAAGSMLGELLAFMTEPIKSKR